MGGDILSDDGAAKTVKRQEHPRYTLYITEQQLFGCCGAYGSSRLSTCEDNKQQLMINQTSLGGGRAKLQGGMIETHRTPQRRNHEVFGILTVLYQAISEGRRQHRIEKKLFQYARQSRRAGLVMFALGVKGDNSRHGGL